MSRDCPSAGGDGTPKPCYKVLFTRYTSYLSKCFNCGFLFQCHSTEHTTKDCPNEYSELDAEGKPREQYTPAEISVDEMFNNNIQSGLNFGNFEKVALQVSLTCYYVPSIFY